MNNTAFNAGNGYNTTQQSATFCPRCRNILPAPVPPQCPYCGLAFAVQNNAEAEAERNRARLEEEQRRAQLEEQRRRAQEEEQKRAQLEQQRRRAQLEAEKNAVYDDAVALLQKRFARTEDFEKAREMFISVSDFFDVSEPVRYCDRKIVEQKNTLIYYDAGGKMLAAKDIYKDAERMRYLVKIQEAIGLVQQAKSIYESIRGFQDTVQMIKECDERIREYSEMVETINREAAEREKKRHQKEIQKRIKIVAAIVAAIAFFGIWIYIKTYHPYGF